MNTRIFAVAFLFLLLFGCSAARKLKRAERLIAKAEAQGARWHVDTVYVSDTVFVTGVRVDSTIVIKPGNTVRLEKERLKVTVVRLPGDSIFVEGECVADTVVKHIPVTVTKTIEAKGGIPWYWLVVAALGGVVIGRVILKALL